MTEKELVWNKRVVKEKVKRKMIKEKNEIRNERKIIVRLKQKSGRLLFQILASKPYSFIPFLFNLHIKKHSKKKHLKSRTQYKEAK